MTNLDWSFTYKAKQYPFWEIYSRSAGQQTPRFLWLSWVTGNCSEVFRGSVSW